MSLTVLSTLAVKTALMQELLPAFTTEKGITPDVQWNPSTVLMQRIEEGVSGDVVILIDKPLDFLVEKGIVVAESVKPLATSGIGVAVAPDAEAPDISTPEAFKNTLLSARSVAISQAGASGIYFRDLIKNLGISEAILAKATVIPEGFTATKIVSGEADLAIQQISELMTVENVMIVGPLPELLQQTTDFSIGIFAAAQNQEEAQSFISFLTSSKAHLAYQNGGLISRLM